MAFKIDHQAIRTSTGTESYTATGFGAADVGVSFFMLSNGTADGTQRAGGYFGFGFCGNDSGATQERAYGIISDDNLSGNSACATGRGLDATRADVFNVPNSSGAALIAEAQFSSWDTADPKGVVADWTDAIGTALLATVALISDDEYDNAECGTLAMESDQVDEVVTIGFEADTIFFLYTRTQGTSIGLHSTSCIGIAAKDGAGGIDQFGMRWGEKDNVATSQAGCGLSAVAPIGSCYQSSWDTTSAMKVKAIGATTFTMEHTGASSANKDVAFLAIKWASGKAFKVARFQTGTGSGSTQFSWPGIVPEFVIQVMQASTAVDSVTADDGLTAGISMFTAGEEYCQHTAVQDNVSTTQTAGGVKSTAVWLATDDGTVDYEAAFTSFDAAGAYTLNVTNAATASYECVGFAVGTAVASTGAARRLVGQGLADGGPLVGGGLIG